MNVNSWIGFISFEGVVIGLGLLSSNLVHYAKKTFDSKRKLLIPYVKYAGMCLFLFLTSVIVTRYKFQEFMKGAWGFLSTLIYCCWFILTFISLIALLSDYKRNEVYGQYIKKIKKRFSLNPKLIEEISKGNPRETYSQLLDIQDTYREIEANPTPEKWRTYFIWRLKDVGPITGMDDKSSPPKIKEITLEEVVKYHSRREWEKDV